MFTIPEGETLQQKQARFVRMVGHLIAQSSVMGYDVTFGDAYREGDPRCHGKRLAIDLNLFIDGEYKKCTEAHRPLGEFWESMAPDAFWGGRISSGDGNHYSLRHGKIA